VDWSLLACGRSGHVTYAPDEPDLRAQLSAPTADGEAWRCLRCASFVPGPPTAAGPAAEAPRVRRGKEVRSAVILRIFAVERYLRALVFFGLAFGLWRFKYARQSIEAAFDRERPVVRELYQQLGFNIDKSKLVGLIQHALTLSSRSITLLAAGFAAYAVVEVVEGTGLWLARRWGEYFAMVATSLGLPLEIYDLTKKVTVTTLIFFAVNLALVLYLVLAKRLFGARGGKRAYDARLRSDSVLEAAVEAAVADAPAPAAAPAPAGRGAGDGHPPGLPGGAPAAVLPAADRPVTHPPAAEPPIAHPPGPHPPADRPADAADSRPGGGPPWDAAARPDRASAPS
jgi:uncharacterized membrane protein (DUF2068 family)